MQTIRTLSIVCLIITCYYFVYYIYFGIISPIPGLGDSWDYHIPIAKAILDGSFFNPNQPIAYKLYFPAASEIFLSLFIFLHIPMTLSNTFAIGVLGVVCYKLARTFQLNRYYALIFATTIVTLNAISRWMNAISIDVWVAIFFCLLIILLENPKKTLWYFFKLGLFCGMLLGSKYTTFIYLFVLLLFYWKKLLSKISITNMLIFLIPFSIFGLFWYIRNFIVIGNPVYPIPLFGLPGKDIFGSGTMLNVGLKYPLIMLGAAFGEYKLWLLSIPVAIIILFHQFIIAKNFVINALTKIFLVGVILFFFFLGFSTNDQPWIMVTSFRYSYPVFITLILGIFLLASWYKKESFVGYLAVASMLSLAFPIPYHPKLIIFYLPLALFIFYFLEKSTKTSLKDK